MDVATMLLASMSGLRILWESSSVLAHKYVRNFHQTSFARVTPTPKHHMECVDHDDVLGP
jgi:hypothetical protein